MEQGINAAKKKKEGPLHIRMGKFKHFVSSPRSEFQELAPGAEGVVVPQKQGIIVAKIGTIKSFQVLHLFSNIFRASRRKILPGLHAAESAVVKAPIRHNDGNNVIIDMA